MEPGADYWRSDLEIERMQGEILDYLVQNAPRREGAPA